MADPKYYLDAAQAPKQKEHVPILIGGKHSEANKRQKGVDTVSEPPEEVFGTPGIPCVTCTAHWGEKREWMHDHVKCWSIECQRCIICKYLCRDYPNHRARWDAWLDATHTNTSRAQKVWDDGIATEMVQIAKLRAKRARAVKDQERQKVWDEEDRVLDALEDIADYEESSSKPHVLDTDGSVSYMTTTADARAMVEEKDPISYKRLVKTEGDRIYDAMVLKVKREHSV